MSKQTTPWKFIKARTFFTELLPEVKDYTHKITGRSGRGKAMEFSAEEKERINKAIQQMCDKLRVI